MSRGGLKSGSETMLPYYFWRTVAIGKSEGVGQAGLQGSAVACKHPVAPETASSECGLSLSQSGYGTLHIYTHTYISIDIDIDIDIRGSVDQTATILSFRLQVLNSVLHSFATDSQTCYCWHWFNSLTLWCVCGCNMYAVALSGPCK